MKIVLAFDKFKGSLSAVQAGHIARCSIQTLHPHWQLVLKPQADGGDGTAEVLHSVLGGDWITLQVTGPLPEQRVQGRYLWLAAQRLALIEMAAASGLVLVPPAKRNPMRTTTYGTGELLADAIRRGATRILLAVGGSATVDGGVGAAQALGWRFLDARGQSVGPGGGALAQIAKIVPPAPDPLRPPAAAHSTVLIEVLCDVDNPLCGEHGAARVFGPQKGATADMIQQLEDGLQHLADLVRSQLGRDIVSMPGSGAAGGLAAGAVAFFDAKLVSGIDTVMRLTRLAEALQNADWVVTGEGCFDEQSLRGKVVAGVTRLARQHGVPVAVIAGSVKLAPETCTAAGISRAYSLSSSKVSVTCAIQQAGELLAETARAFATDIATKAAPPLR